MALTYLLPNKSASYAGNIAYTPPNAETARATEAQNTYKGKAEPVTMTFSTIDGSERYIGTDPVPREERSKCHIK